MDFCDLNKRKEFILFKEPIIIHASILSFYFHTVVLVFTFFGTYVWLDVITNGKQLRLGPLRGYVR